MYASSAEQVLEAHCDKRKRYHAGYLQLLGSPLTGQTWVLRGQATPELPVPLPGQIATHSCLDPGCTSVPMSLSTIMNLTLLICFRAAQRAASRSCKPAIADSAEAFFAVNAPNVLCSRLPCCELHIRSYRSKLVMHCLWKTWLQLSNTCSPIPKCSQHIEHSCLESCRAVDLA